MVNGVMRNSFAPIARVCTPVTLVTAAREIDLTPASVFRFCPYFQAGPLLSIPGSCSSQGKACLLAVPAGGWPRLITCRH